MLDVGPKSIQQINFTENLNGGEDVIDNTKMFFIIEEVKEFSKGTVRVFNFILF